MKNPLLTVGLLGAFLAGLALGSVFGSAAGPASPPPHPIQRPSSPRPAVAPLVVRHEVPAAEPVIEITEERLLFLESFAKAYEELVNDWAEAEQAMGEREQALLRDLWHAKEDALALHPHYDHLYDPEGVKDLAALREALSLLFNETPDLVNPHDLSSPILNDLANAAADFYERENVYRRRRMELLQAEESDAAWRATDKLRADFDTACNTLRAELDRLIGSGTGNRWRGE